MLSLSDLNGRAPWIFSTRGPVLVRSNDVLPEPKDRAEI